MGMKFASEAAKQAFLQSIVNGILAQQNASNPASGIPQQQAAEAAAAAPAPKPVAPPAPPALAAKQVESQQASLLGGVATKKKRAGTLLTGPGGLTSMATVDKRTLLGG